MIQEKIDSLLEIVSSTYGLQLCLSWKMNPRLRTTAGRAFWLENRLEFNPKLYAENTEKFLQDTVAHEVAHIVAYHVYGSTGHDKNFYAVCTVLGADAARCHNYKIEVKGTWYECGCMKHLVTSARKAWMTRGKVYKCKHCKEIIREVV